MIVFASMTLVMTFLRGGDGGGFGEGIWWRRGLLIISLFAACFLMPIVGFLVAGTVAFAGGMIASMHDNWTPKTAILYSLSGLAVMNAGCAVAAPPSCLADTRVLHRDRLCFCLLWLAGMFARSDVAPRQNAVIFLGER